MKMALLDTLILKTSCHHYSEAGILQVFNPDKVMDKMEACLIVGIKVSGALVVLGQLVIGIQSLI